MKKVIFFTTILLLIISGCSNVNNSKITDLENKVASLETELDRMRENAGAINVYGNGVYYCQNPFYGIWSIEFVSSNVIRVFGYDDDFSTPRRNEYYLINPISTRVFVLFKDVDMPDKLGIYNLKLVQDQWASMEEKDKLLKTIEVSQDHFSLYYAGDHQKYACLLNEKWKP